MDIISYLKCFYYIVYARNLAPTSNPIAISERSLEIAKSIRGVDRDPTIIIHGVMPRSGTVYAGSLLGLHPDLHPYPNQMWEIPFLPLAEKILHLQRVFFQEYKQNDEKIGESDFLPLFGASFLAYLNSYVAHDQRILLKESSVTYLDQFFSVFPHENLLVLVRDGRDVISSTLKTWPRKEFHNICMTWDRAARTILKTHEWFSARDQGYALEKFEDIVSDPEAFVIKTCRIFGLDEERYPFNKIETIPVRGSSVLKKEGKVTWEGIQRPKNFNPVGRWHDWSVLKKKTFKAIAGQSLLKLGYCNDLNW